MAPSIYESSISFHILKGSPGPGTYVPGQLSKPESVNAPGFSSTSKRNDKLSQKFFTRNFVSTV